MGCCMMLEPWATDFLPGLVDVEELETKKPTNLGRFIRYCESQNIGWFALALCICGADPCEVMGVFCGFKYKPQNKRIRSDLRKLDLVKLTIAMGEKRMTHKVLCKSIGRSKATVSRMFFDHKGQTWCWKSKHFVDDCEKALGLESGALIYKEG